MQNDNTPSFLEAFIGSFVNFKKYPAYTKRSGLSSAAHYLLLVTLCCSLYAFATTSWLTTNISPYMDELAENTPTIKVVDGEAFVDIEQPYFVETEGTKIAVIDTTQKADIYLDEYKQIIVISKDRISSKDANGKIQAFKFSDIQNNFTLNSSTVAGWVEVVESWFLPGVFLLCFLWQVCWKAMQLFITAGVITLIQKSRPNFLVHLKLATLALCPAMAFGVLNYALGLFAFPIPAAAFIFWGILAGLTYYGSEQLRNTPEYG